jgi:hypothetical protein
MHLFCKTKCAADHEALPHREVWTKGNYLWLSDALMNIRTQLSSKVIKVKRGAESKKSVLQCKLSQSVSCLIRWLKAKAAKEQSLCNRRLFVCYVSSGLVIRTQVPHPSRFDWQSLLVISHLIFNPEAWSWHGLTRELPFFDSREKHPVLLWLVSFPRIL